MPVPDEHDSATDRLVASQSSRIRKALPANKQSGSIKSSFWSHWGPWLILVAALVIYIVIRLLRS